MKVSAAITINNRAPEVCKAVADSLLLEGNQPDELIVAMDRCSPEVRDGARAAYEPMPFPVRWVTIPGQPGWLCPAKAWNMAFMVATGDVLYCFSSETVQAKGNLSEVRDILERKPVVIHGKCECSCGPQGTEINWGDAAPGNLFCDAAHPRPLGFIWACRKSLVTDIGGFDEAFMPGFWFDDDDFFLRLFRLGVDFLFTDAVSGTHLHHERPSLSQEKINLNLATMIRKYGTQTPWVNEPKLEKRQPGRTYWRHL